MNAHAGGHLKSLCLVEDTASAPPPPQHHAYTPQVRFNLTCCVAENHMGHMSFKQQDKVLSGAQRTYAVHSCTAVEYLRLAHGCACVGPAAPTSSPSASPERLGTTPSCRTGSSAAAACAEV